MFEALRLPLQRRISNLEPKNYVKFVAHPSRMAVKKYCNCQSGLWNTVGMRNV